MKRSIIFLVFVISTTVMGQSTDGKQHSREAVNCKTCHACEYPTAKDPCLVECPRGDMVTIRHTADEGPATVLLSELSDRYYPVKFSHKLHAEMSEITGGCESCHHHNMTGPILACKNCHELEKTELNMPGLKGAYHRQCMDCHREWSHQTECNSCHTLKSENQNLSLKAGSTVGAVHPRMVKPGKLVYETSYEKGKIVTFYHSDHAGKFQLACTSCHKNQTCVDCHDLKKRDGGKALSTVVPVRTNKTKEEKHQACFGCHSGDEDRCSKCHRDEILKPFDHSVSTEWALGRFHDKLECTKCHIGGKFTKRQTDCVSCHNKWDAKTFSHGVTGLILDANHSSLECDDCHTGKKFSQKPGCSNCHDDKSYPKDKPGKLTLSLK